MATISKLQSRSVNNSFDPGPLQLLLFIGGCMKALGGQEVKLNIILARFVGYWAQTVLTARNV